MTFNSVKLRLFIINIVSLLVVVGTGGYLSTAILPSPYSFIVSGIIGGLYGMRMSNDLTAKLQEITDDEVTRIIRERDLGSS